MCYELPASDIYITEVAELREREDSGGAGDLGAVAMEGPRERGES